MRYMQTIKKYLIITVSAFVFSVGLAWFIDPNNLAPGGMSGIAIILSRLLPLETGTIFLLLNIPVLILGFWQFGWKFMVSTLYATVLVSGFTNLLEPLGPFTQDIILAVLVGSSLSAVGMGMILKVGSTTGGTDIIVKCLRKRYPHIKTGTLFLLIDAGIVLLSGFIFKQSDSMLYSALAVIVISVTLDFVLYGPDGAKLIYIISDNADIISERLLKELDVGITFLDGSGAYEKNQKKIIMCVMRKHLAPKTEGIVKLEDPYAFMIVTNATEIYGEGYKSYFRDII